MKKTDLTLSRQVGLMFRETDSRGNYASKYQVSTSANHSSWMG